MAALVVGLLAMWGYLRSQQKSQQQTADQLANLQQQVQSMAHNSSATTAPSADPTQRSVLPTTAANGTELEKLRQSRAVMEEGWRLLSAHDPQQAKQAVVLFREAIAVT